jgi:hypothetical protein
VRRAEETDACDEWQTGPAKRRHSAAVPVDADACVEIDGHRRVSAARPDRRQLIQLRHELSFSRVSSERSIQTACLMPKSEHGGLRMFGRAYFLQLALASKRAEPASKVTRRLQMRAAARNC